MKFYHMYSIGVSSLGRTVIHTKYDPVSDKLKFSWSTRVSSSILKPDPAPGVLKVLIVEITSGSKSWLQTQSIILLLLHTFAITSTLNYKWFAICWASET